MQKRKSSSANLIPKSEFEFTFFKYGREHSLPKISHQNHLSQDQIP